jgi:hypothetical protein
MLSNLSDLLNQRVDPKTTQQAPPQRATAADSSFLLQQVQQRAPQMQQFYNNPNNTVYSSPNVFKNQTGWNRSMSEGQRANYFPPVQQVAEGTKKRVATEKGRIAAGQAPKTKKGQEITNEQEIQNIQNDQSGFINPNVYQGRNFNPGAEGQNIDFNAPYAVYDPRIEPQEIRVGDSPAGINTSTVPIYDPLAITPWAQLSKVDQKLRLEKYGTVSTPYENASPVLLPSDGNGNMRMSVPVQGSPTGRIAVKGSGISGNSQGGNNKKATGSIRVTGVGVNAPSEAVFLTKGKNSEKGKGQGRVAVQGQVVTQQPGQSTTSMVGMAPSSTYIQNATPNKRQQGGFDAEAFDRVMQNSGTETPAGQLPEGMTGAQGENSQDAYTQPYRIVNAYQRSDMGGRYTYPDKAPLSGKRLPLTFMVSPDGTIIDAGYQGKAGNEGNTIWGYGDRIADPRENFIGKNISEIDKSGMYSTFSEGQGFGRDYNPVQGEEPLGGGFYRKIATNATKQLIDPKGRRTKEQVAKEIQDLTSKQDSNNWWNSISQKNPFSR